MSDGKSSLRIAIIGGGISGLSAAYHLQQQAPQVHYDVFEASHRWGGVLQTTHQSGFLVESSADSFLDASDQPWATELINELGLANELIEPNPRSRKARILFHGQLHDVPAGFYLTATTRLGSLFGTRLLSFRGKLRLACERWVPKKRDDREESLRQFAVRRVGREVFERLVQPLISGIYTADPDRLSVSAALPKFVTWEQEFGSLTAGLHAEQATDRFAGAASGQLSNESGARYAKFRSLHRGMGSLIEALVSQLRPASLHVSHRVITICRGRSLAWQLQIAGAAGRTGVSEYDGVIFAAPHLSTASIVNRWEPKLASALNQIPSASVAVVSLGVHQNQLSSPPDCFGIVVPLIEQRNLIAASFSSVKFSHRAPADHELIRVFIGGACHASLLSHDDETLRQIAIRELRDILGFVGQPVLTKVCRWTHATPQYELGHTGRLKAIQEQLQHCKTIVITGNAFHGIGIPQCIHESKQNVDRLLDGLERMQHRAGSR